MSWKPLDLLKKVNGPQNKQTNQNTHADNSKKATNTASPIFSNQQVEQAFRRISSQKELGKKSK